eukprot:scaffold24801_cov181-Cylindrotheca_fusiformis.AAC.8
MIRMLIVFQSVITSGGANDKKSPSNLPWSGGQGDRFGSTKMAVFSAALDAAVDAISQWQRCNWIKNGIGHGEWQPPNC